MENEKQTYGLSMILSKESLRDWDAEYHSAFDSMELSRIKAWLSYEIGNGWSWDSKDEVLDYMVAKINEVVWDWETPPKVAEVLKEDLADWMQRFDLWLEIIDAPSEPLEWGFFFAFGEDWGEMWDRVFDPVDLDEVQWDFADWDKQSLKALAGEIWSAYDAVSDDIDILLTDQEWSDGLNARDLSEGEQRKRFLGIYDADYRSLQPKAE